MADTLRYNGNITEETLLASARLHNRFPPDTAFPEIDLLSDGFKELCAIIAKHNLQSHFRLRLLHRHVTIPDGHILLGSSITEPRGYWTTLARIPDVDVQRVHSHTISVDTTSSSSEDKQRSALLLPSEFREGPASAGNVDSRFYAEITDCLWANGLEKTLGLESIQGQAEKMIEFSFDTGSLLLAEAAVRGEFEFRETGWAVTVKDDVVDKDGETRCIAYASVHIQASKIQVKGVLDALAVLRDEGVLV